MEQKGGTLKPIERPSPNYKANISNCRHSSVERKEI